MISKLKMSMGKRRRILDIVKDYYGIEPYPENVFMSLTGRGMPSNESEEIDVALIQANLGDKIYMSSFV